MRVLRVLVVAVVLTGGVAVTAPGASASAPATSKACKSLKTLLNDASHINSKKFDGDQVKSVGQEFKSAAKSAPKAIRSALTKIGNFLIDVGNSSGVSEAQAKIAQEGKSYSQAVATVTGYLIQHCNGS
ncbi:MAG TPA: hypothetical protein VEP49_22115 [Acidimicrobiia bacterium]|nr:hypothetical protein [Acidimicrobiia bacterium]